MPSRLARVIWGVMGALAGAFFGVLSTLTGMDHRHLAEQVRLPHHVPQFSGGVSLRFAMVHDVIHERFPKHGREHYEERNRLTRQQLEALDESDPRRFSLVDDLGVGLDRLGRSHEAIEILRDKLTAHTAAGITEGDIYTTYANLGTFLIHANFADAIDGSDEARARFREGVEFIRESVRVNPEAHFGRERWQAAIAEFLLAAMDDSQLLTTFDCLGNRLDRETEKILAYRIDGEPNDYGHAAGGEFASERAQVETPLYFDRDTDRSAVENWEKLHSMRKYITKVGAEPGWQDVDVPSHRERVPFDEPVLGIIGMWRQGGGANPHFAPALGETMLRIGQRYIAWTAFARATEMADRFWPDPELQQFLKDHCRKRQQEILESLRLRPSDVRDHLPSMHSPAPPELADSDDQRLRFESELAYGRQYQQEYQDYEVARIADGVPILAEDFFAEFHAARGTIASAVGAEEVVDYILSARRQEARNAVTRAHIVFGAGLGAMFPLGLIYLFRGVAILCGAR